MAGEPQLGVQELLDMLEGTETPAIHDLEPE